MSLGLGVGFFKLGVDTIISSSRRNSVDGDGGDNVVNAGNTRGAGTPRPPDAITVTAWIKPDNWDPANPGGSQDRSEGVVSNINTGGYGLSVDFAGTEANPTTKLKFSISVANNGSSSPGYLTILSSEVQDVAALINGWAFLAATYEGTTARLWAGYDGSAIASMGTAAHGVGSAQAINYGAEDGVKDVDVMVGADPNVSDSSGTPYISSVQSTTAFDGKISDVAIWDGALSEAALNVIYNDGIPADPRYNSGSYTSSGDLVLYYTFSEGIGTETEDLSGNGVTGKLQNGMTFDSELPEDAI